MATEMKIWQVAGQTLQQVEDVDFEAYHLEKDLESWIESNPKILGESLLVVGRQLSVPGVGVLDLLCIDREGMPVIVELKRNSTPREAVAQGLDYASWLDTLSEDELRVYAAQYLDEPLDDAFSELFDVNLPEEIDCQKHRIILVAPKLDEAAERIINYLSERYSIRINAVFFKYAKLGSEEILVRSMLVSEEVSKRRSSPASKPVPSHEDLDRMAEERNVAELVKICRQMPAIWDERASRNHGGSWAYANGLRTLLRIDVAGGGMKTPVGELDLWIRCKNVAEATSTGESVVRSVLQAGYSMQGERSGYLVVRLRTKAEAEKIVQQMKEWVSSSKPQDGVAPGI